MRRRWRAGVAARRLFLGPLAFYRRLREMSLEERAGIGMTGIGFVNNLYRQEELKRRSGATRASSTAPSP